MPPQKCPAEAPNAIATQATTQELPQRSTATPKVKEGMDGTPCYVADGPKRLSAIRSKRRHRGVEVCPTSPIWGACPSTDPLHTRPTPCRAEARDIDCMKQLGYNPSTTAMTQRHDHRCDRGTPSASLTITIDQGWPQRHVEAYNAEFVGRSGHDPPTAVTMGDNNDNCNRGPPIAPSHPHC